MIIFQYFISLPFWLGFCFCTFYVLFPFLYSYFKTPQGFVWAPINNHHRFCSDNTIYAACVQEARLNFFKHKHPCSPLIGNLAIDFTRVTSYRTAALLGLFLPDERLAFILSFATSILIQYILVFLIAIFLFHFAWIALMVSLLVIFWFKILIYLKTSRSGIKSSITYIKDNILNQKGDSYFDLVNDNFRYVIMSVSGIYVWITFLIILYSTTEPQGTLLFFIFLFYFILIPFVYPPVSLLSLIIFVCSVCVNTYTSNNYTILLYMVFTGFLASLLFLFTGIISRINEIRQSNTDVLNMSHNQSENYSFSFKYIYYWLRKDFFFLEPLVLFLIIFPIIEKKFYFIPIILLIFILLRIFGLVFRKISLIYRFTIRGGLHYLFFSMVCSVLIILNHWVTDYLYINIFSAFAVLFLILFPLIGNIRMAIALNKSGAFYMPKEEWEVYSYIKKKTKPRTTVMAFSFSNLQLVPVYTHSNLYVTGAEWLESPENALEKYIKALKFINNDANGLLEEFNKYFSRIFSYSLNNRQEEKQLEGFHLINTLIYFPYVKKIAGITLLNENSTGWSTEFIGYLKNLIDKTDNYLAINDIDYILIDKININGTFQIPHTFIQIYENKKYVFYRNRIIEKTT